MKTSYSTWLMGICAILFVLVFITIQNSADSQMKRDEETAQEVDKINPVKPAAEAAKTVIDNTVNKVLPVEIPMDSKLVKDEKACYQVCRQEKANLLKGSKSEVDRGHAWASYHKCRSECPEKVANQNRQMERDVFNKEERYPAGSAIEK